MAGKYTLFKKVKVKKQHFVVIFVILLFSWQQIYWTQDSGLKKNTISIAGPGFVCTVHCRFADTCMFVFLKDCSFCKRLKQPCTISSFLADSLFFMCLCIWSHRYLQQAWEHNTMTGVVPVSCQWDTCFCFLKVMCNLPAFSTQLIYVSEDLCIFFFLHFSLTASATQLQPGRASSAL